MRIARLIAKCFKPEKIDFAQLGEQLRQLHAGKIDRLDLPPGVSFQLLLPECPKCGYRAEGGAAPTIESEIEEINESFDRIEQALDGIKGELIRLGLAAPSTEGLH